MNSIETRVPSGVDNNHGNTTTEKFREDSRVQIMESVLMEVTAYIIWKIDWFESHESALRYAKGYEHTDSSWHESGNIISAKDKKYVWFAPIKQ
jgi:hypothetical protein